MPEFETKRAVDSNDSKAQVEENVWQSLLSKSTRKTQEQKASLVVLGDAKCGKSTLLSKFTDRHANPNVRDYLLSYSFVDVKNKHNIDKEEILSHMNIWQISQHNHIQLAPLQNTDWQHTAYAIMVDLSEPHRVLQSVTSWLQALQSHLEATFATMPADSVQAIKTAVSKHVQCYVDPSLAASEKPLIDDSFQLNTDVPKVNLGVPIIVVGCKSDLLVRQLKSPSSSSSRGSPDDQFEFLTRRLRRICLDYGAALIYTSAAGKGQNADLLQDYVFHRLYGFDLIKPSKVEGNSDDANIHIWSGFDSVNLINLSPLANKPGWEDSTPFETVFPDPNATRSAATTATSTTSSKSKSNVKAQDNMSFLIYLKTLQVDSVQKGVKPTPRAAGGLDLARISALTNTPPPSTPSSTSSAAGLNAHVLPSSSAASTSSQASSPGTADGGEKRDKRQIAVKQFFRSLLDNSGKAPGAQGNKEARANAQSVLKGLSGTPSKPH